MWLVKHDFSNLHAFSGLPLGALALLASVVQGQSNGLDGDCLVPWNELAHPIAAQQHRCLLPQVREHPAQWHAGRLLTPVYRSTVIRTTPTLFVSSMSSGIGCQPLGRRS